METSFTIIWGRAITGEDLAAAGLPDVDAFLEDLLDGAHPDCEQWTCAWTGDVPGVFAGVRLDGMPYAGDELRPLSSMRLEPTADERERAERAVASLPEALRGSPGFAPMGVHFLRRDSW